MNNLFNVEMTVDEEKRLETIMKDADAHFDEAFSDGNDTASEDELMTKDEFINSWVKNK